MASFVHHCRRHNKTMHPSWPKKAALCLDTMIKEVQMKYKYLAGSDFASLHRNVNCRIEMRLRLTLTASIMKKDNKECKTRWGCRTLTLLQKVQIRYKCKCTTYFCYGFNLSSKLYCKHITNKNYSGTLAVIKDWICNFCLICNVLSDT